MSESPSNVIESSLGPLDFSQFQQADPVGKEKPSEVDLAVISLIDQRFWETGLLVSVDKLVQDLQLPRESIEESLSKSLVVDILKARGIDLLGKNLSYSVLTPRQVLLANLLMNTHDPQSVREKCKAAGVSTQQYNAWLREPAFSSYLRARAEASFGANDFVAYQKLMAAVEDQDLGAIKLFFEMRGIYLPTSKTSVSMDVQGILNQTVEVLTRHISNPDLLRAIAIDIEAISSGKSRGGAVGRGSEPPVRSLEPGTIFALDEDSVKLQTGEADGVGAGQIEGRPHPSLDHAALLSASPSLMEDVAKGTVKKGVAELIDLPEQILEMIKAGTRAGREGPLRGLERVVQGIRWTRLGWDCRGMPRSQVEIIKTPGDFSRALSDKLRKTARNPGIFGYKPHPKQVMFHKSPAKTRLFIGGNRSGKTEGGTAEDVLWCMKRHPLRWIPVGADDPIRGRVVCVDFLEGVDKIVLPAVARKIPPSILIDGSWERSYDKNNHTLYFNDDGFLEFMSYEQDIDKFAGTSRHFVHFDEEPPREIYIECMARLIDTGGHSWMTMTPLDGMTWVHDEIYVKSAYDPGFFSIEVDMDDNPYIGEQEKEAFLSTLSVEERQSRKQGRFVALGGKIYPNFGPKNIIDPVIPDRAHLWLGMMDHGLNNPTAWLWAAVTRDGTFIVFDEHYESNEVVRYHAEVVNKRASQHGRLTDYNVGDPSIANRDPITGTTIQLEYNDNGVLIVPANNEVRGGINRVKSYLGQEEVVGSSGEVLQKKIITRLYITRNCVNLIHEMSRYRWARWATKRMAADRNKKDEPHKKDDHACDALRYGIASRPDGDTGYFVPEFQFDAARARESGIEFSTVAKDIDPAAARLENVAASTYGINDYSTSTGIWIPGKYKDPHLGDDY